MQIYENEDARILEIWLTNKEKGDESLRNSLTPLVKEYKSKKFQPVFFISGEGDLWKNTADLLKAQVKNMDRIQGAAGK